jgi:propanol-preferring alcohol dehydrogenase
VKTMRAAVLRENGRYPIVEQRPIPAVPDGSVLVHVRAAGVCHTDLHLIDGVPTPTPVPLVLGHEIAGVVARVGDGVPDRWQVGDRVMVYYYDGCGACRWCRSDQENLCPELRAKWGFDTDGGYCEYLAIPSRCLVPVPPGCSDAEAATIGCSGTTGVHVIESIGHVGSGSRVVIIGAGGIGLSCAQVALALGATVAVVEPRESARTAAEKSGVVATVHPDDPEAAETIRAAMGGEAADVVVDAVGGRTTPMLAIGLVRRAGTIVLVGYTGERAEIDLNAVITRELRLRGSVGATRSDARRALELAAAGRLRPLVHRTVDLDELAHALAAVRDARVIGRMVVVP